MKTVLIPLPHKDFDPTEVAIPWKILISHQIKIVFSTPDGKKSVCDQIMLTGKGLGLLAPLLQADSNARSAYNEMFLSAEFNNPIPWSDINKNNFDGLLLPGGHDKGMREYLESKLLQNEVVKFFTQNKPVGAICHGVILAARSKDDSGKSVLFERKTTSLLQSQELTAWTLTCLWLKDYYLTYPITVEAEVKSCLANQNNFISGPTPLFRDSSQNLNRGFVVKDGNYISARWPGDAHRFAHEFLTLFETQTNPKGAV